MAAGGSSRDTPSGDMWKTPVATIKNVACPPSKDKLILHGTSDMAMAYWLRALNIDGILSMTVRKDQVFTNPHDNEKYTTDIMMVSFISPEHATDAHKKLFGYIARAWLGESIFPPVF